MTKQEAAVLTAYTGINCCKDFSYFHKYVEGLLKRPIFTHELAHKEVWELIKDKSEPDFMDIVSNIKE